MKKYLLLLIILSNINNAKIIDIPNFSKYKTQKNIGAILGDFNNVNNTLSLDEKRNIINKLSIGPLTYTYINNNTNIISLSKNITDFLISKYDITMLEYYNKKEKFLFEYENILRIYFDYLVKNKELELLNSNFSNIQKNILKTQFENGIISEIDYENMVLELKFIEINKIKLENNIKELKKELSTYSIKTEDIEEINIENLNIDFNNYVKEHNEKQMISKRLEKLTKLANNLPQINVNFDYNINTKDYKLGVAISKNFKLDLTDITESNYEISKEIRNISVKEEIEKFDILKRFYEINLEKLSLAKKQDEVNKLKYEIGKISYKDLLESKNKLIKTEIDLFVSKNEMVIFLLKRGI